MSKSKYNGLVIHREKYICKVYNLISDDSVERLEDIPKEAQTYLLSLSYDQLITPFIKEDLINGKSITYICNKYLVTAHTARFIGYYLGIFKSK